MDDFQYRDLKISSNTLKRLQTRSSSLSAPIKNHLQRWEEITADAGISFTIDEHFRSASGEFLGREFHITSEFVASGSDLFALISLITQDSLSGKAVLVDSYCINTFGRILGSDSKSPLEVEEDVLHEYNEYSAICEVLYSLAARNYQH